MNNFVYQRFKNDDQTENRLINSFLKVLQPTMDDIKAYYENLYKSPELGRVLYDKQLVPIYKLLERSIFLKSYADILNAQQTIGSPNAYCDILYSIFGSNATISITRTNPLHIKINIIARYIEYFVWVDEQYKFYITTEEEEYLGFAALIARITNRQLADILQQMTNAGTYLEFTYKQGSLEYIENFIKVGTPAITNTYMLSGITQNDYIKANVDPVKITKDDSFELSMGVKNLVSGGVLVLSANKPQDVIISVGENYINLTGGFGDQYSITINVNVSDVTDIAIKKESTIVKLIVKTKDEVLETQTDTVVSPDREYDIMLMGEMNFDGAIDLTRVYFKKNNSIIWTALSEKVDYYSENYNMVGAVDVSNDYIASGFHIDPYHEADAYLESKDNILLTSEDEFEINVSCLGGDFDGSYPLAIGKDINNYIIINADKENQLIYFERRVDGEALNHTEIEGSPKNINLKYSPSAGYTITVETEEGDTKAESVTETKTFSFDSKVYIGCDPFGEFPFNGTIDLKTVYVKKNNVLIYQAAEELK